MSLKLAIWDVDGTIVDSRSVITRAMASAFEACGHAAPGYDQTRHVVGLGLSEACAVLAPGCDADALERIVAAYKDAFIAERTSPDYHEPLYDGALETLQRLAEENWLIAMATGKSRRGIAALFEAHPLQDFFDTIHCADDGPGKPHPAMVQAAMDRMGAVASEALMIGDAVHDMRMGRAAGVHCLGVDWGFGTREELREAGAHHVSGAFTELNAEIDGFAVRLSEQADG